MADYGHDLRFGSFLTPQNKQPAAVVELAQISEQAGLDLATFQDHPYQSAFLDTWTLLSYVAAQTERISLAPNVANLPLRPPAVLARSAASLDLLSKGRLELGLGAGGFWDGIEAMGGRRLTPGQAVAALDEAIDIIRGIWTPQDRSVLRVEGEHHRATGAKRGPAPAHPIEIWLGAYKPRMLRLTGRKADGWLPSLGYIEPEQLGEGNAIIDEAAEAAGRSPRDIRRLLNINGRFSGTHQGFLAGPPDQWVEQLTELALTYGTSTFILAGDDPAAIQIFGRQVAPAVREAVAAHRAGAAAPQAGTAAPAVSAKDVKDARDAKGTAAPGGSGQARPENADSGQETPGQSEEYTRLGLTPTPDDGTRLSDTRLWDESTRPRRPASGPDVTYTRQGRQAGKHLIDVHDVLRKELTEVRTIIAQVRDGARDAASARSAINEMTMRQNNWVLGAYCANYCRTLTQHHTLEDQSIFPYLRANETSLEPVLDRLQEEHIVIHKVLEDVDAALVRFIGAPDDFTELQEAVDVLTDTLLSHLAYEERELVEPLARHGFYADQL